jgi:dihydropyrimidinase
MAYGFALNDGELLKSFEAIARAGGIAIVHAENWDVIQALTAQNLAMGRTGPEWHPRSRPPQFEAQAAGRAIDLAEFSGIPLHIFHVSTGLVVERVAAARSRGLPVYAETCPQYLLLDDSVFERPGEEGGLPICSPPIRTRREQNELWAALGRGQLQVVSTDHAPFTREQKRAGLGDYSKTPGGVPGIQSRMMLLYTYGVRTGRMSLPQFAACCAATPARIMGFSRKGQIAAGFDADIAVLDPEREMILSTETLQETSGWSPYEGLAVRGVPRYTISRGELIVADGEFRGQEGWGQFVRRQRPRLNTSKIDTSATH